MSVLCPNCKKKLSCGCQKRTASDGKKVCTNCLSSYEASIAKAIGSKPSGVTVFYNGPGK